MSRPIWKGNISFGLVNIPVTLFSAENRTNEIHFHLLDKKNKARIRYEKINDVTGKEVPYDRIVKAYEFEKGNYIVVDEKELEKIASENSQTVQIEDFINVSELDPIYYEKPYYLIPSKQGEKGYVILRDTLKKTNKIGIAFVVLKAKQHLAAIFPYKNILAMNLIRFAKDILLPEHFTTIKFERKSYQISKKELDMAERLVDSMSIAWDPKKYHDSNKELLQRWIKNKITKGKGITAIASEAENKKEPKQSAKVIDFMSLLEKSMKTKDKKRKKPHKGKGRK